jgi:hypothetical protein
MTRLSVSKWVARALAMGAMAALKDQYHRPQPPRIGEDAKAWVVHLACSKPKDLGYAAEVWSRQALAGHVREHAVAAGFPALSRAAKATVPRILAEPPLPPEKVKYYLERRDPEFEPKMRQVLVIYREVALQNQQSGSPLASNVVTVSVDEKPGVQASPIPRRIGRRYPANIRKSPAITSTNGWVPVPFWRRWTCTTATSRRAWRTVTGALSSPPC